MRIAVVGGNGFIGREFVDYASQKNHETVVLGSALDAFSDSGRQQIIKRLSGSQAMVFLAAKRPIEKFSCSDCYYNIKLAGTYFEYARCCNITNIVITSSRTVYSSSTIPWSEKTVDSPLSLYGASKQAVDALALYYNASFQMQIKSLRLAQVIGLGERKGFLLNTFLDNAMDRKKLTIYGTGSGKRQYIYVKDVCDALLHSLNACPLAAGIFNIGLDYPVSILELAEIINETFQNDAGIELLPDKPEDKKRYFMDVTKAEQELRWKPAYDLRQTFADIREHC